MINIENGRVRVIKQKGKSKKITGTKLGAILEVNPYETPFSTWCDITKVYKKPFDGDKYTKAGETIEPLVLKDLKGKLAGKVMSAEEYYGRPMNYVYDYFTEDKIFGGMWDGIQVNQDNKPIGVIEIKTTGAVQNWKDGEIPPYYQTQVELYAYLLGVRYYTVAVVFLEEEDYINPNQVKLVEGVNYKVISVRMTDEHMAQVESRISYAREWYATYVDTLLSPIMNVNDKTDMEIRSIIMTDLVDDKDLEGLLADIKKCDDIINEERYTDAVNEKKKLEEVLRSKLVEKLENDDNIETSTVVSENYEFSVKKTVKPKDVFDEKKFKKEEKEMYNKYVTTITEPTYRKSLKINK